MYVRSFLANQISKCNLYLADSFVGRSLGCRCSLSVRPQRSLLRVVPCRSNLVGCGSNSRQGLRGFPLHLGAVCGASLPVYFHHRAASHSRFIGAQLFFLFLPRIDATSFCGLQKWSSYPAGKSTALGTICQPNGNSCVISCFTCRSETLTFSTTGKFT